MTLTGLHLLLTYECNFECDHCFVWAGPGQTGTLTLAQIEPVLAQAKALGTIEWIYFEGGEPFLYHAILLRGARRAADLGFRVGVVSNGYWATEREDAVEWLRGLEGVVQDLSISCDSYHGGEEQRRLAENAYAAAERLGIPAGVIRIAEPGASDAQAAEGQLPNGESAVMYRGRAAQKLAPRATPQPWTQFTECPHENLREPGRVHVDPLGNVHLCQGISLGNMFRTPLAEICARYDPEAHPVAGPLLAGGPAGLVRRYGLPHAQGYADACHLCDEARRALRPRFPDILTPDQMYGVIGKR
jgi:MoaA/NifB/PqqE/SkfB family radical SAM enzyme